MTSRDLKGVKICLVEDEFMLVMLLEDMLSDFGCEIVAVASNLKDASEKISSETFDVAILDVNLNGEKTTRLAEMLRSKGVPFMFCTGYGAAGVPEEFRTATILNKPFEQQDLKLCLEKTLPGTD